MVVINSTFTNNRATHGGAVVDVVGKTKIMFSTFANNSGQTASTLSSSGTMEVWASIIYGTQIYEDYCAGNIVDQGGNLQFPNADCGDAIPVSDPKLLSLGDYGGATQTFALDSGSPAIDSVPASICQQLTQLVDQRGLPRDVQACDSGAYEE
ncbi:MAG: choice-of-anchor Q domain-containing protein, partial [Anaerolineae bacterium]